MKYIKVQIPLTCSDIKISNARDILLKAGVETSLIGNWPYKTLHIFVEESDKSEDISYIFALGMLVGQFIH